ncbi:putative ribonuclease H protein [Vitis vinifera]|uniref:Putative ribonuclease H protein n=1 Tax=Vitis vinifera TaxID=29760 RepID=A0A438KBX6_VITVI|nr:putative ribonuclease H protein [Vitis vinifera]
MAAFSEGRGVSKGGKSWFAVESKTFEISIEEIRVKSRGVILERSKGFSSWMKFGVKSFSFLLEGVEDWCRGESSSRRLKVLEEGGRKYRLECRSNKAGRYLLCSVRDLEAKRFCLVFPEGKGLVRGWFLLAQKLRALGISNPAMSKGDLGTSNSIKDGYRVKGKEKGKRVCPEAVRKETGELKEALWVHVGERDLLSREEQLSRCLVGCFGDSVEAVPSLSLLKEWAYESWSLKGGLKISSLGGALKWGPEVGCCRNGSHLKEVWVKVVGLPLHLWSREVFKSIGESCGGFIAMDEETTFFSELQWARILVRALGKFRPGTLQVAAGNFCWTVSLWWENPPWFSEVVTRSVWFKERQDVRDEGGGDTRASGSVREVQNFQSDLQSQGTGEQVVCGKRQREAATAVVAEGRRPVATDLGSSNSGFGPRKEKGKALKGNGCLGLSAHFWHGVLERPSSARAPSASVEGVGGMEAELLAIEVEVAMELTLRRWRGHAEAVGVSEGLDYGAKGELGRFEPSVGRNKAASAFGDWSEHSWDSGDAERGNGLALVPVGEDFTSPFEKRSACHIEEGGSEEGWSSSSLAMFSRCLGMPTEGFKEEILYFLRRMKGRIEQKGKEGCGCSLECMGWYAEEIERSSGRNLGQLKGYGVTLGVWEGISIWVFSPDLSWITHFPILLEGGGFQRQDEDVIWNKEEFGLVEAKKGEALKQVEYWDEKEKYAALNMEGCEARNRARESYKMANAYSRRNWLSKLKVNGCWHSEENNLKNSVVGAFQELYSEEEGWCPSVDGISFMGLDNSEAERLENPFSEEEVFAALTDLGKDKAPGPDGFTMAFWLFGWDVVKGGAEDLKDFKPISLVGSLYKFLAKVLASRIKKVMGKVISEPQNAFVESRQILDAVLIANEVVDSRLKSNQGGVMCKLDIEKADDHVCWKFLLAVLKKMGFGERWIKWIEWCISIVRYFVLINGSPSGFFRSSRGLRQGDPLSPYLFVIVIEVFSCLMRRAISGGFLSGWTVRGRGGEGILISHLLFADDTLVFWLKVNLEKSELIPIGRVNDIEDLALKLGCKVGGLPSSYLGLPLGAPFKSEVVWDSVEERFRKRLAMWKRQYISKGGRLTLIRSTLSSLPVYFMSLFLLPRKVRLGLEKIQRDFLWGGGALEQRPHLVRWNLVCLERKKGGLGVRNLALMNKALLGKWNWRFAIESEALWKQAINHKYGVEEEGWCTRAVSGRHGVGLWKAIRKEWLGMYSNLAYRVGNGRRVRFWKDKWCGDEPLCESFPSLFAISLAKDAWVSEVWNPDGGAKEDEDKVVWTASRSGDFSVKSLYSILEPGGSALFPYVGIWRVYVPPKVAFFAWEASWGKILTLDQLQRRGYSLANRREREDLWAELVGIGELWDDPGALAGTLVFGSASFRKAEALNQIGLWGSRERESILSVEEIEAKRLVVE